VPMERASALAPEREHKTKVTLASALPRSPACRTRRGARRPSPLRRACLQTARAKPLGKARAPHTRSRGARCARRPRTVLMTGRRAERGGRKVAIVYANVVCDATAFAMVTPILPEMVRERFGIDPDDVGGPVAQHRRRPDCTDRRCAPPRQARASAFSTARTTSPSLWPPSRWASSRTRCGHRTDRGARVRFHARPAVGPQACVRAQPCCFLNIHHPLRNGAHLLGRVFGASGTVGAAPLTGAAPPDPLHRRPAERLHRRGARVHGRHHHCSQSRGCVGGSVWLGCSPTTRACV
jgi:hypothetical protein